MSFLGGIAGDLERTEHEPRRGRISTEPLIAMNDGYLVVVVNHVFEDMPSWVEWDAERHVLTIMQMGGQMDEAHVDIKPEEYESLKRMRKLLLVSNDNKDNKSEKIVHYVAFLARD